MLRDFTKEKFDIFIQAGQSNSKGSGFGSVAEPFSPCDQIWYLNENFTLSLAEEKVCGNGVRSNFGIFFANEYLRSGRLKEGRRILIIRAAEGGTGFLDNRWKPCDDLFLRMMEMIRVALSLNPENRLVALLWHQGETDALCNASFDQHFGHLSTLLSLVRETFDAPSLPFIAGDFVMQWKLDNLSICQPVVDAMKKVCESFERCAFVETEGLESNAQSDLDPILGKQNDTIHFSRGALEKLGKRYFDQFVKITGQDTV